MFLSLTTSVHETVDIIIQSRNNRKTREGRSEETLE